MIIFIISDSFYITIYPMMDDTNHLTYGTTTAEIIKWNEAID